MISQTALPTQSQPPVSVSNRLEGDDLSVGDGFRAKSFRATQIGRAMDPLVMVDHYVMTTPTFGAHPHAGMSAVSLLFEDSEGLFHNRDSLGNDFDLQPSDLYWLKAGRGAVHDESPRPHARTHGLQVFINVPQSQRFDTPDSLLVRSREMPVIRASGYRVKVALGESNGQSGKVSPSTDVTILDGVVDPGGLFSHHARANRGIWIHAIAGNLNVTVSKEIRSLSAGQAVAISTKHASSIRIGSASGTSAHFALLDGLQIGETYVQEGPFVMGTNEQIADIKAAYQAGLIGDISSNAGRA